MDLITTESVFSFVLKLLLPRASNIPETIERPMFYTNEKEWEGALRYATGLRCALPFLIKIDRSIWRGDLPGSTTQLFGQLLSNERMKLAILDEILDSALDVLVAADIPVIVLKGMDLGRRVYHERILRPMTDVDLCVPQDFFNEASDILKQSGFKQAGMHYPGRDKMEFSRGNGQPVLELHAMASMAIWERSLMGAIPSLPGKVRSLSFRDNFTYLVRHAAVQHVMESPLWLNDIHFLLESSTVKFGTAQVSDKAWEEIILDLRSQKTLSAAWFVLMLLRDQCGTSFPAWVLEVLKKETSLINRRLNKKYLDPQTLFNPTPRSMASVVMRRYLLRDGAIDVLRYGIGKIHRYFLTHTF
ncbi:MAG: nucleotidyltransferase family protein [Bdellovibrionota bacterium]